MNEMITTYLEKGIFLITINRPEKLNVMNRMVIEELAEAVYEVHTREDVKAAIITGAGPKAFVAGADITGFTQLNGEGGRKLAKKGQDEVFDRIENCPKPIIAAVNGYALGGGCELAMACHLRVASSNAKFGLPEVNLGLIPGYGGTQRLTQLIGKGKAMELMMTGTMIDATEAHRLGLVNYITEPENLLTKVHELLGTILAKAPLAIGKIIELVNLAAFGDPDGLEKEMDAFGELFTTADMKEGVTAFLEKRKATFTGK